MTQMLENTDSLYAAFLARDPSFDGRTFVGVSSTQIFCRFTCPARKPKQENCTFFKTADAAQAAGYRPCKRCQPLAASAQHSPIVEELLGALDKDPAHPWTSADIRTQGYDTATVRRHFGARFGKTFLQIAKARRLSLGCETLKQKGAVICAQHDAGYESSSGFSRAHKRHFGRSPSTQKGASTLTSMWIDTPLGQMLAVANDTNIVLLEFHDRKDFQAGLDALSRKTKMAIAEGKSDVLGQCADALKAYFSGDLGRLSDIPIDLTGTGFQEEVWQFLQSIPAGQTGSYSDLARQLGKEKAVRAVANANARNKIAIRVPCHRIIGTDGTLTGYAGGLWRKKWLLAHEAEHARDDLR